MPEKNDASALDEHQRSLLQLTLIQMGGVAWCLKVIAEIAVTDPGQAEVELADLIPRCSQELMPLLEVVRTHIALMRAASSRNAH